MEALPAGPAPAPRNQLIVGATFAAMAMAMLTGGMLAIWALERREAINAEGTWLPSGVTIPEVPSNVMLIAFAAICSFAHWAIWSAKRDDRPHTIFALASTAFVAVLVLNAQFFVYSRCSARMPTTSPAGIVTACPSNGRSSRSTERPARTRTRSRSMSSGKECREFAEHWLDVQRTEFKRLGCLGDWDNPYTTMNYKAEAGIFRELAKFAMSNQLYRGRKSVMWSVVEKTALAEAEVEYHDHTSTTIIVRFPVANGFEFPSWTAPAS